MQFILERILPDEYTHSNYTRILKGANAKAKANAAQGLPELLEIAAGTRFTEDNRKEKHTKDAKVWLVFDTSQDLLLPVFGEDGEIERYNVFNVMRWLVRHARRWEICTLYDIMNIKKETSTLFQSE